MKTGISSFCEACSETLAALPAALEAAAAELATRGSESSLSAPLAAVNDLRARVRSLTDKLAGQQAYLLIFGPLKSGKSTLMNALSGAYVSEVTSLPGYPCLVYVRHAPERRISVTRYNGRESLSTNGEVLKGVMADSHLALAREIRAAEQRGVPFDPTVDFPEAIRRVDVKLPVPSLEQSSTVLVDTPGLYSRMNFGYDTLTREFRNSAACAVFVVKTDNLYFEQVFEEFNQLLNLFSRIFLVINVDSSKRDLQADGKLGPSAESRNPDEIVEAFTTLSMAGPLRQAYEQNRVRIHALDLMNAASERIQASSSSSSSPAPTSQPSAAEPTDTARRFAAFTADLTDYLNSSDYTQEFMRDSIRQARLLCGETLEVVAGREIQEVFSRHEDLGILASIDEKLAAGDRLLAVDWESAFLKTKAESANAGRTLAETEAAALAEEMRQALERWYTSADSLRMLEEQYWAPLLVHTALAISSGLRNRASILLSSAFGGVEATPAVVADLGRVGLSLSHIAAGALAALHEESIDPYLLRLDAEKLPVTRSVGDWLLLRSGAKVRRRLFGERNAMPIEPGEKTKRLSNKARLVLLDLIHQQVQPRFAATPLQTASARLDAYIAAFCAEVRTTLESRREQLRHQRSQLIAAYDLDTYFVGQMRALTATASEAIHTLDLLARREAILPLPVPQSAPTPNQAVTFPPAREHVAA